MLEQIAAELFEILSKLKICRNKLEKCSTVQLDTNVRNVAG